MSTPQLGTHTMIGLLVKRSCEPLLHASIVSGMTHSHVGTMRVLRIDPDFAEALQRVSCSGLSFNMKQASGGGLLAVLADI